MSDAVATLLSTIVSTLFASAVAWLVAWGSSKTDDLRAITDQIGKLIELSMQYPFVEDPKICDQWPNHDLSHDQTVQYSNYCCFAFNLMSKVWKYCGGDSVKIRDVLHVEELAWKHRCWWTADPENETGYSIGFRQYVNRLLKNKKEALENVEKSHSD